MTLTAAGPAGTAHDPFAGTAPDDGAELAFPAERYTAIGATEQDVADLTDYFDSLTRQERREALAWHDARDDEQIAGSLARFREARDAFAGLGGLTDEQLAELAALSDDEREALTALASEAAEKQATDAEALAALTPEQVAELEALSEDERAALAGMVAEQAAYDALSDTEKAALAALTPDQLAELRPEPAAAGAEPAAEPVPAPAATSGADDAQGAAQTAAQPTGEKTEFSTEDIADLTIAQVEAVIGRGEVTAAQALAAEQARGEKARPRLVEKLTALAAE